MISQIIVWTVAVPLAFGILLGILTGMFGETRSRLALLLPLAAMVLLLLIEGWPGFPPVAAKQKLPFVLLGLTCLFGVVAARLPQPTRLQALTVMLLASLAPALWLGSRVLGANPAKAVMVGVLVLYICGHAVLFAGRPARNRHKAASPVIATLFTLIATAVVSVTGGYIGMAQGAGALAAMTGGWLLVRYIAFLRGDDEALLPRPPALFAWLALVALAIDVTALFSPKASPSGLLLAVLPLGLVPILQSRGALLDRLPRPLRPLAAGALLGLPAFAAILVSVLGFIA